MDFLWIYPADQTRMPSPNAAMITPVKKDDGVGKERRKNKVKNKNPKPIRLEKWRYLVMTRIKFILDPLLEIKDGTYLTLSILSLQYKPC